jgi:hypothetical protein
MRLSRRVLRRFVAEPLKSRSQLARWVRLFCGLRVVGRGVCDGHDSPLDYLCNAYFEPAHDQVVWAPRGGGKTRLAAVATLLDMLHKPGTSVRILGGSMEQSLRVWEHLLPDLERVAPHLKSRDQTRSRRVQLLNHSGCAVIPQSQRAVRGLRVSKLRCDEVELFKPDIWEAAQLVTRSGTGASSVRGTIEAISTVHVPGGLMSRIVESAGPGTRTVKWCLMEVLERCPLSRDCTTCPLWEDCRGRAKAQCDGFFRIDDAITMKRRVSRQTWESEMLCLRPSIRGTVFPSFDRATHVACEAEPGSKLDLAVDFGFSNPFVCLWVERTDTGRVVVHDEYVREQRTIDEHLAEIARRGWALSRRLACDPAGTSRNDQTGRSSVMRLRERGFVVVHRVSRIIDGIERIRAALSPAHGPGRLRIHARCVRLIRALESYRYPASGGEIPEKDGVHDHLIDALRYWFVNEPSSSTVARKY